MRLVNRVLAAVLGLTLLVGGLLVATEIVIAGFGRRPWVVPYDRWYASARMRSWDSAPPRWIFLGLVAAGLALLVVQLLGRRPAALALAPGAAPADVGRRSLEKSLAREAARVDGVAGAKARIAKDNAQVEAWSSRRQTEDLPPRVAAALDRRLSALGLARPPAVRVKVEGRAPR